MKHKRSPQAAEPAKSANAVAGSAPATGSFKVGPGTKAVAVVTVNGKAATARFTLK